MDSYDRALGRVLALLAAGTVVLIISYGLFLIYISWPIESPSISSAAQFAESFGIVVAIISAATFLIVVWAMLIQRQELELQRVEMRRVVAVQHQNIFFEQVRLALDHPDLIAVYGFDPTRDLPATRRHMFAHSIFLSWFHSYLQEIWTPWKTYSEVERFFLQSSHFREYWNRRRDMYLAYTEEPSPQTLFDATRSSEFIDLVDSAYASALSCIESNRETNGGRSDG